MESEIEHYLKLKAKKNKCLCLKFNSQGQIAVPDRILITKRGEFYLIELKDKGKRLKAIQKAFHDMLIKNNVRVFIIDSKIKIDEFFTCFI